MISYQLIVNVLSLPEGNCCPSDVQIKLGIKQRFSVFMCVLHISLLENTGFHCACSLWVLAKKFPQVFFLYCGDLCSGEGFSTVVLH